MRVVKSLYFWLVLGTAAFIAFAAWSSSGHVSQRDQEAREEDGGSSDRMPSFAAGFVTAVVVGGFWFSVYHQMHPPERKHLQQDKEKDDV
jgi:threonine/homoserine/homoserine lactone efflux protein